MAAASILFYAARYCYATLFYATPPPARYAISKCEGRHYGYAIRQLLVISALRHMISRQRRHDSTAFRRHAYATTLRCCYDACRPRLIVICRYFSAAFLIFAPYTTLRHTMPTCCR